MTDHRCDFNSEVNSRTVKLILFLSKVSLFQVELSPKKPLFRMGGRHELTCRISDCSKEMTFSWRCLQDQPLYAEPQSSSNQSSLIFKNVNTNIETCTIQCRATCQGTSKQQTAKVQVYCEFIYYSVKQFINKLLRALLEQSYIKFVAYFSFSK